MMDAKHRALERAVEVYGDTLTVDSKPHTENTLQGTREAGWCVWGRSHGGNFIGCLYRTRELAESAIADVLGKKGR